MLSTLLSLLFVYVFITLGYLSKRIFKEDINTKTLTLMSVYFLQPFVTIWGFSTASLDESHINNRSYAKLMPSRYVVFEFFDSFVLLIIWHRCVILGKHGLNLDGL